MKGEGLLQEIFSTGRKVIHSPNSASFQTRKVLESHNSPLSNGILAPITLPSRNVRIHGAVRARVGVLAVVNKTTTLAGRTHPTDLTWEDEVLINFAAELQAILTYQQLRTRDFEADFERKMHGARTNLHAAATTCGRRSVRWFPTA